MTTQLPEIPVNTLYEQDFYLWIANTVKQLKEGNWNEIDITNLIEELESMGRSERRELKSRLIVLLVHLLKWKYQPIQQGESWIHTINEQCRQLELILEDSASLKPFLQEVWQECYTKARREVSKETGLAVDNLPTKSPFSLEETLNSDYLPN